MHTLINTVCLHAHTHSTLHHVTADIQAHPCTSPWVVTQHSVCMNPFLCLCVRPVACPLTGSCYAKCHTSKKDSPPTEKMKSTPSFRSYSIASLSSPASFTLYLHHSLLPPPPPSPSSTQPPSHLSVSILFSAPLNYLYLTHTLTLVCSPQRFAE